MKTIRRWLGAVGFLLVSAVPSAHAAGVDLHGRVMQPDHATPVTNATVFIYTASPKTGTAVVCPFCYLDCGKKAKTDVTGSFLIPALDATLRFRLLVLAPGLDCRYVEKVDPAEGEKTIELKPIRSDKRNAPGRIAGMVLDEEGKALAAAIISPEGVGIGDTTRWGGNEEYVDPLAVTDEEGRFVLFCTNGVDSVHAIIEGRGVAQRWFKLKPGADHLIRMHEGVGVTGRVEQDGAPVAGIKVGLTSSDRAAGNYFNCAEIATDAKGRFTLANVPANMEFVLYSKMDSANGRGIAPSKTFTTGTNGSRTDLGALELHSGLHLAGRVVLSDGKPVPPDTRLFLGRDEAWDHAEVKLDTEGRFELTNVPPETISLHVRIQGYKCSHRNPNLDWLNGGIIGRLNGNLDNFIILLEPGKWQPNGEEGTPPDGDTQPRKKPLRGMEL